MGIVCGILEFGATACWYCWYNKTRPLCATFCKKCTRCYEKLKELCKEKISKFLCIAVIAVLILLVALDLQARYVERVECTPEEHAKYCKHNDVALCDSVKILFCDGLGDNLECLVCIGAKKNAMCQPCGHLLYLQKYVCSDLYRLGVVI